MNYIEQERARVKPIWSYGLRRPFTPKQNRRIKHKEGRLTARWERLEKHNEEFIQKRLLQSREVFNEECPTCGAEGDASCRTKNDKPTRRHKGRK
jgi:hypothetical protein